MPSGRHPSRLQRRDLSRHLPRHQGGGPGHAYPRLLAIGGHAGRGDAWPADPVVSRQAQGRGLKHVARHRRRDPGRRGSRDHLRRQGEHGAMARCRKDRAWPRPAHDLHDHVRPYRASHILGAASAGLAGFAGGDGRLHRIRAAAVRAYGSADVSQGRGSARTDLPGSGAHARRGAACAPPAHHEHPDVLGEDGASRERRRASTPAPTISAAR